MDASSAALRVAVVGAGPSGFYTADALLKARDAVTVDIFDRLPAPFGLVRYGVAPDHQKIKSVTSMYARTASDPRVRFWGNVEIGRDVTVAELQRHYHAVVFAYGAPDDRRLGIPGEDLIGSLPATDFVAWYNGHPDYAEVEPPLDGEHAVVIGVGNVAVDVARILAKTATELARSDIADHALEALGASRVRDVVIAGRRGPAEAKFTTKELREFGELEGADVAVDPRDLALHPASERFLAEHGTAQRNVEVLRDFAARAATGKPRRVTFRFLYSPRAIESDASGERVASIVMERNELIERQDGSLASVGTGVLETWPAQLVLRSVGYHGSPLPGVPFDADRGVIPNDRGRVLTQHAGVPVAGLYTAGWIKRGPNGVIGTNKADAMETVATLLGDRLPTPNDPRTEAVEHLLHRRGVDAIDFEQWRRIDRLELTLGKEQGRPRVKLVSRSDLLSAAVADTSDHAAADADPGLTVPIPTQDDD
ncbi:MAG: FAD-dependent oxidoreductase [Nocardiopsis sp. BM-2018]|nr:MAG: FAD-dependent oxidoreductase [Nocardiopsis sp. BM-2018]